MGTRSDFSPSVFHSPVQPAQHRWQEWFLNLPAVSRTVDRLGITEIRRRLFHMSPAIAALVLPLIPDRSQRELFVAAVLATCVLCLTFAIRYRRSLTRVGETNWMSAVVGYLIPVATPLLLLPGHPELGLVTLQIIGFGDGCATLGGLMVRGPRLPWNPRKTIAGLACFIVCGSLTATYSFWGEAREVPIRSIFLMCGVATLCAAIVESLPIRSNDNFRVGMTALLAISGMSLLVRSFS